MEKAFEVQIPEILKNPWSTKDKQIDDLFGKGIVLSSVVLLSGPGGSGKSTFMRQLADILSNDDTAEVIYNGLEEDPGQVKLAVQALGLKGSFYITQYLTVEEMMTACISLQKANKKVFLVVDSIQTLGTSPKSRLYALRELSTASKKNQITTFVISQVGKTGIYLGSGEINHIVDVHMSMRKDKLKRSPTFGEHLLTVEKNRFGAANVDRLYTLDSHGFKLEPPDSFKSRLVQLTGAATTADSAMRKVNMGLRLYRGVKKIFG